jgi:transcription elongation factor Elf1
MFEKTVRNPLHTIIPRTYICPNCKNKTVSFASKGNEDIICPKCGKWIQIGIKKY